MVVRARGHQEHSISCRRGPGRLRGQLEGSDQGEAIKGKAPDETAWCSAKDLRLFVAKSIGSNGSSSEWMKVDEGTEDALEMGSVTDDMRIARAMLDRYNLSLPSKSELHVLVVVSTKDAAGSRASTALRKRKLTEIRDSITPSSFAKCRGSDGWVKRLKEFDGQIECHRDIQRTSDKDPAPLPLVLLNETFARFEGNCRDIAFGKGDCEFAMKLCQNLFVPFDNEEALAEQARALLQDYLLRDFNAELLPVSVNKSVSDGSYRREGTLLLNLECKLQKGDDGGDPTMQNIGYCIKHLPDPVSHQLPCFLVDICGLLLSIFGIVNISDEEVICEPLVASFPLIFFDNEWIMTELIRTCASLKAAVRELTIKCIEELAITRQLYTFDLDRPRFPYKDTVEINGTTTKLQYVSRLEQYVFLARDGSSGNEVIVKFAKRYGQQVREFCAQEGFGPKLLAYEVLPCGWSFVVMEKLGLVPLAQATTPRSDGSLVSSSAQQQLLEIKSALESVAFVHGDLRGYNVMWDFEKKRVVLIDFDWAGKDGVDEYPPFMNSEIAWPPGAESGKLLRVAHDAFFVDEMLAKLEAKDGACIANE